MGYTEKQLEKNRLAMTMGEEIAVELTEHYEKKSTGVVRVQRFAAAERNARATGFLLKCCGAGLLAAMVPPHFPWPIAMAGAGLLGSMVKRRQSCVVLGGQAHCPQCGAFQIVEREATDLPFLHFCSECRTRCQVEAVPSAGGGNGGSASCPVTSTDSPPPTAHSR